MYKRGPLIGICRITERDAVTPDRGFTVVDFARARLGATVSDRWACLRCRRHRLARAGHCGQKRVGARRGGEAAEAKSGARRRRAVWGHAGLRRRSRSWEAMNLEPCRGLGPPEPPPRAPSGRPAACSLSLCIPPHKPDALGCRGAASDSHSWPHYFRCIPCPVDLAWGWLGKVPAHI